MVDDAARPVQIIGSRPSLAVWLQDLWRFRGVLVALCLRDIRGKYKQATLGVAWAVVQPVVQIALFTFVFRGVAKIQTEIPYPVFALAALLPYNLFQQVFTLGTPAFVNSQHLVTKVYFPRLYTILAGGASSLINAAITTVILVVAMLVFRVRPSGLILLAVPMLAAIAMLGVGLAALLGAANARFRDVQHALPLATMALMYVSPVLYPLGSIPEPLRVVAMLNPVTGLVEGFRSAVTGLAPHSWELVAASLLAALLVFAVGVWVFERTQAKLVDVL